MANSRVCSIPECGKPHNSYGFCNSHSHRYRRHGTPFGGRVEEGEALRFYENAVLPYTGNNCLIWPYARDKAGYAQIWFDGKVQYVSRLTCQSTSDSPSPDHKAAHNCGKGHLGCVAKRHLEWKTSAENSADMLNHGTLLFGEKAPWAKLTTDEVLGIRRMASEGVSERKIAKLFRISRGNVSSIVRRKSWAHV